MQALVSRDTGGACCWGEGSAVGKVFSREEERDGGRKGALETSWRPGSLASVLEVRRSCTLISNSLQGQRGEDEARRSSEAGCGSSPNSLQ